MVALSALIGSGSALVKTFVSSDISKNLSGNLVAILICGIGILGAVLSETWKQNISGYLSTISDRYEIIKDLEQHLKYEFMNKAHFRVGFNSVDRNLYLPLAFHECIHLIYFSMHSQILLILRHISSCRL